MSKKFNNVLEYIEAITEDDCVIEYADGAFEVTVEEDIDINDVYSAINNIVDNVVENEFEYELVDIMLPYYYIELFTDIEAPMVGDGDDTYPDYMKCYEIAAQLNLEYELSQASVLVASYIYMMTQNIWRRLDYHKSEGAFVKKELQDALATFYDIMDDLDQFTEQQADIDVDGFVEQLNDMTEMMRQLNEQKSEPALKLVDAAEKSSANLAVAEADHKE